MIRLLKPLEYYQKKYGTWQYGLNKLYLLMEKQHNRGQDGAGVATLKLNPSYGHPYIDRARSDSKSPIKDVFDEIYTKIQKTEKFQDIDIVKENIRYAGELYLGHLRYATHGKTTIENVHPVMRFNNWKARNLVLAGNFNLTNVDEIFDRLVCEGQHPRDMSDTVTVLEQIGYYLDTEYDKMHRQYAETESDGRKIAKLIEENLDVVSILRKSTENFDGGYTIEGMIGNGDAFILRDPNGIRPAFYYADEEVVVAASERPVIQTAFKRNVEEIKEITPGNALIIKRDGQYFEAEIRKPAKRTACSFERIYFSRGTDKFIYEERKKLGHQLIPAILKAIDYDLKNTVLSYIPNTAEIAFYGMLEGIEEYMIKEKRDAIINARQTLSSDELMEIVKYRPRVEKIAVKDVKLRTFITEDKSRNDMVEHVYDVTYGVVRQGEDNLVIIDDSIVRGTTLKTSILRMLDRLNPKKIVIVSSAPQIRYPDCYGIDMTRMTEFCAFRAALELLHETGQWHIVSDVYRKCKEQQNFPKDKIVNHVKEIYAQFTDVQISKKIAKMLRPDDMKTDVEIVFQTIEGVQNACPDNNGDWYFSGNYPTPGGNRVVNNAYINYFEKRDIRPY
ncbi:MAG: amidophosphoribosyltransferase [Prevotellaceae bacterium]|nr:amidophosphoribosyltransferase [Prevotellaceae bacterium]